MIKVLPRNSSAAPQAGFTRLDLLALLLCLACLLALAVPVWAAAQEKSGRETCKSNLLLIGKAYHGWAEDHGNRVPWRVPLDEGGTRDIPGNGNAWVHMAWLSNYLASPKLLACPADKKVRPAENWSRQQPSGFLHGASRGNALSYFVGLDVQESSPQALLSGDPNLNFSARIQTCDYANVNVAASLKPGDLTVSWTTGWHGDPGNILRYSGTVETLRSSQLRQALGKTKAVHEDNHVLAPR